MKRHSKVNRQVLTALFIALCVVLPMAFHSIPNAGSIFCPMHIPVLLCGMVCGPIYGGFCGLVGPLLSSLLTGMPPMGMLPGMMVELMVYGLVTGLLTKKDPAKNTIPRLYVSLITAMLAGRVISGIVKAFIFLAGEYSMQMWATASFVTAFPGIVIQLVFIPVIYKGLVRAKVLE